MRTAAGAVAFVAGVALVITTVGSVVRATILPRGVPVRVARAVNRILRLVFRVWTGRSPSYERRDQVMAGFAPASLLVLLGVWLVMLGGAFVLMYLAVATTSVTRAIELSGSSLFTLGTATAPGLGPAVLTYAEAGFGLLLVTLLITYLPSIYAAFSRRENMVNLLRVRAGNPPRATSMLVRYHRIEGSGYRLTGLWQSWEGWFADVEETHTSFAILPFFRSPQPDQSWITAAGTLLDAAALWISAVEHPTDPDAQLCIRAGFLALRRIASYFSIPFDPDPSPRDPISISRGEFDAAVAEMGGAGMSVKTDTDSAWDAYRGWRVNYDTVLLRLARMVEAPLAPWVSDRSPVPAFERRASRARRPWAGPRAPGRATGGRPAARPGPRGWGKGRPAGGPGSLGRRPVPPPPRGGGVDGAGSDLDTDAGAPGDGDGPVGFDPELGGDDVGGPPPVGPGQVAGDGEAGERGQG